MPGSSSKALMRTPETSFVSGFTLQSAEPQTEQNAFGKPPGGS